MAMDRRTLILSGLVSLGAAGLAHARVAPTPSAWRAALFPPRERG